MRLNTVIGAFLLLITVGCSSGTSLKKIDNYIFLHDNSSKVWLVDKLLINKNDYTPMRFRFKQIIVFHESRNAYFYRLNEMGEKPGAKTYYWMDRTKNEFGFLVGQKEWVFEIKQISRTKLVLRPKNNSYPYTMVLVPFPEY
ncbi:MAG: hypothetical protein HYZ43_10455 [Flavobacteriia bacterium]|nr:hypothetical protein [Flavobacteriia bacterium]